MYCTIYNSLFWWPLPIRHGCFYTPLSYTVLRIPPLLVADISDELQRTHADLKDAMELCNQHEALLEERNNELSTLDSQVR